MHQLKLAKEWQEYLEITAKADKLFGESEKLADEVDKLDGEASRLWERAIKRAYGKDVTQQWYGTGCCNCRLSNGDVYKKENRNDGTRRGKGNLCQAER